MHLISVVIQGWWKRVVVNLLGTCFCKSVRLDLMLYHIVWMELSMVNVWMNDDVNDRASCLSLSMSACGNSWIFLRGSFARCSCADEWIDIAWWSPSLGIVRHCEVRDGRYICVDDYRIWVSFYCAVGPVDVEEIEIASHPEYIVSVYILLYIGLHAFLWVICAWNKAL